MNLITCAIANGGKLMKPQVIDSVKADNGTVVKQYNPTLYKALMTQEESQILTDLMIQVVEVGTALNALIDFPLGHAKVTESHRIVF